MFTGTMGQIFLLGIEGLAVSCLLLSLFRLRNYLDLSPLYITIGLFQHIQVMLVVSVYVPIGPNISVSPGSAVLFTASLFVVLLIYIREDASEARKLIYGILVSNLALAGLGVLFSFHYFQVGTNNPQNVAQFLLLKNPLILVFGTFVLLLDTVLMIFLFEAISRITIRWLFIRILITMSIVLTLDTILFMGASFYGHVDLEKMLFSGVVGKLMGCVFYAAVFSIYLKFFEAKDGGLGHPHKLGDIFQLLTYRQKYDILQTAMMRDGLTGIYNRGYFDEALFNEIERAKRDESYVTLLMIDVDNFKQINDRRGHLEGDRALQYVAKTLEETARVYDTVCRYGGEEFAIVLSSQTLEEGMALAERIRVVFAEQGSEALSIGKNINLTVTIGVASFPKDGESREALIHKADNRLLDGKRLGRNRVIGEDVNPEQETAG